jgi:hypothetical protein
MPYFKLILTSGTINLNAINLTVAPLTCNDGVLIEQVLDGILPSILIGKVI